MRAGSGNAPFGEVLGLQGVDYIFIRPALIFSWTMLGPSWVVIIKNPWFIGNRTENQYIKVVNSIPFHAQTAKKSTRHPQSW